MLRTRAPWSMIEFLLRTLLRPSCMLTTPQRFSLQLLIYSFDSYWGAFCMCVQVCVHTVGSVVRMWRMGKSWKPATLTMCRKGKAENKIVLYQWGKMEANPRQECQEPIGQMPQPWSLEAGGVVYESIFYWLGRGGVYMLTQLIQCVGTFMQLDVSVEL